MALAILQRPDAPEPLPTERIASPTPTASAAPTVMPPLPTECAADVRGTVFATGPLEQRLAALREWAAGSRAEGSLVLTDAVLTESLRAAAARPGAPPFRDGAIAIRPDGFHLTGVATAAFLSFPIRATLVPRLEDGQLRLDVRDLEAGGLPGPLRDRLNELVAQAADPAAWQIPLRVEAFVLRSGCAVVRGTASPR